MSLPSYAFGRATRLSAAPPFSNLLEQFPPVGEGENALNAATLNAAAADLGIRDVLIDGADGNFAARADMPEIDGKTAAGGVADLRKGDWASIRIFAKPASAAVEELAHRLTIRVRVIDFSSDCLVA